MTTADYTNAYSTLAAVFALVSKKIKLCLSANSYPSTVLTSLSNFRSLLFPTRRIIILEYALSLISSNHLIRLSNVYLLVIS